ncbi:MAG: hypothetical protein AB1815_13135 [Bacillota bacterium]
MIYVKGAETLEKILGSFDTTNNLLEAALVVIEMPGNLETLRKATGKKPVFVIVTGMLTMPEWKAVNMSGVIIIEKQSLVSELKKILAPGVADLFENDLDVSNKPSKLEHCTQASPKKNQTTHRQQKRGNTGICFSTAGGVGKTFLSLNLATCAAMEGIETVVVDLDLRSSEMDFAIGLVDPMDRSRIVDRKARVPKNGWLTVANWRGYPPETLKENILRHSSGLFVVPCYPMVNTDMEDHEVRDLIYTLTKHFDLVMIDGGLDFTRPHIRAALEIADVIYLLGDQEIKTIGKVFSFLAQASNDLITKSKLVINMVTTTGYYAPDEIAARLGYRQHDVIPLDPQGVHTARRSRRATVQIKGSTAGKAVWKLAAKHLPFDIAPPSPSRENILVKIKNKLAMPFKRKEGVSKT